MKKSIVFCSGEGLERIQFVESRFLDYVDNDGFDFIEYNGGLHETPKYRKILAKLRSHLTPEGVIGLSVFSTNKIVREIREILTTKDTRAHVPFSENSKELVKRHLEILGYPQMAKDDGIVSFIAASGEPFSRIEIVQDLEDAGFSVLSWAPYFVESPYSLINDYAVQSYKSFGVSEGAFIDNTLNLFRFSVYLANGSGIKSLGRAALLNTDSFMKTPNTVIMDRSGGQLGAFFASAVNTALNSLSSTYIVRAGPFVLKHLCTPDILPALSLLSKQVRIEDMFEFIKLTFAKHGKLDEMGVKVQLVNVLNFLLITGQILIIEGESSDISSPIAKIIHEAPLDVDGQLITQIPPEVRTFQNELLLLLSIILN